MWFGDLVTMRWWEDTWLNESFADFLGFDVAGVAAGYTDSWTGAALTRKPTGYLADRRRSTHRIAEDPEQLVDVDTAFANFDMITYAKGNAVLRQLGIWLGDDFLAGVNTAPVRPRLRQRDARGVPRGPRVVDRPRRARLGRRVAALDGVRHPGGDPRRRRVPVLTREGSRPHRFSVAAYDDAMRLVSTRMVDLADQPLRLDDLAGLVVVPNAGDETFAALRLDEQSWAAVMAGLSSVESPLTRAMLWWTAIDLAQSKALPLDDLVRAARPAPAPGAPPRRLRGGAHPRPADGPALRRAGRRRRAARADRRRGPGRARRRRPRARTRGVPGAGVHDRTTASTSSAGSTGPTSTRRSAGRPSSGSPAWATPPSSPARRLGTGRCPVTTRRWRRAPPSRPPRRSASPGTS